MAFCSTCGAKISDGINFCPSCGARVGANAVVSENPVPVVQFDSVRQAGKNRSSSLNEISKMIQYFEKKRDEYCEMDRLAKLIPRYSKTSARPLQVFGIILTAFGAVFLFSVVVAAAISGTNTGALVAVYLVFTILLLGSGIGMIVGYKIKNKKRLQKLAEMRAREEAIAQDLAAYYEAYGICLIGIEYSNPQILIEIYNVVKSGRADSIGDAINILLDDAHKRNVRAYAASAAAGARAAAFFSAADFIRHL